MVNKIEAMPLSEELESFELIAKENFYKWNAALESRNPKEVAGLYQEGAPFLPTLSNDFIQEADETEKYFEHFLEKNPSGEIMEESVQPLSDNCYCHSGRYNFEVGSKNNRKIIEARFTFIWEKDDQGEWKIKHHHSSLRP